MLTSMYDPFARGPFPVSVISTELRDASRQDRRIPLEIWLPAHARHLGQDLAKATQDSYPLFGGHQVRQEAVRDAEVLPAAFPVVVFSHGFAGHRRQSTFFCTHLASRGYVVVAPDHGGNTLADVVQLAMSGGELSQAEGLLGRYVLDRPRDVSFVLDAIAARSVRGIPPAARVEAVGVTGHSFGGWTALVVAGQDARVRAALPLAPAGGSGQLFARALGDALQLDFAGRVETLYLALERDSLLPLAGIERLFQSTSQPARMFVLMNADHMHFCDRAERSHEFFRAMPQIGPMREIAKQLPPISELVPGSHAYLFANGLGTAHMDAVLKHSSEARAFLSEDPLSALHKLGVRAECVVTSAPG
jgi:dienelactone hydrolase